MFSEWHLFIPFCYKVLRFPIRTPKRRQPPPAHPGQIRPEKKVQVDQYGLSSNSHSLFWPHATSLFFPHARLSCLQLSLFVLLAFGGSNLRVRVDRGLVPVRVGPRAAVELGETLEAHPRRVDGALAGVDEDVVQETAKGAADEGGHHGNLRITIVSLMSS